MKEQTESRLPRWLILTTGILLIVMGVLFLIVAMSALSLFYSNSDEWYLSIMASWFIFLMADCLTFGILALVYQKKEKPLIFFFRLGGTIGSGINFLFSLILLCCATMPTTLSLVTMILLLIVSLVGFVFFLLSLLLKKKEIIHYIFSLVGAGSLIFTFVFALVNDILTLESFAATFYFIFLAAIVFYLIVFIFDYPRDKKEEQTAPLDDGLDSLEKAYDLMQKGAISPEEYQEIKEKVLKVDKTTSDTEEKKEEPKQE